MVTRYNSISIMSAYSRFRKTKSHTVKSNDLHNYKSHLTHNCGYVAMGWVLDDIMGLFGGMYAKVLV